MKLNIKELSLIITLSISSMSYSQDFSGTYFSQETSYKDDKNPEANFKIAGNYKIVVDIPKRAEEGIVFVYDIDDTQELWIYKILAFDKSYELEGKAFSIYKVRTQHFIQNIELGLIFYKQDDQLNFMIKAKDDSQVFFDLTKR